MNFLYQSAHFGPYDLPCSVFQAGRGQSGYIMAANASLAALYRPQTFAEVVGQDMVKSILSRAAREDRVAPAYLLSGTRGVGKTTIARIFAKALNCEHAPTGEPCNECEACRRITQGNFVDVVEIDGASNRGIDDIRRLRDAVGYAPLEGRYKVFIIDEAHMLTKEAFNALLKTLEEPPAHVTFIMATTEQHKFPVTIVSRCQHFVFRQIPEATLEAHICDVLRREGRPFEKEAAHLIARRAAGSVRDSMSLLGQVLALGSLPGEPLTASQTREVLGLAGQEVMDRLLDALAGQDAAAITVLVRELLAQGADMGFFLRELCSLWRNLFLMKQAGREAAGELDMPEGELERLSSMAGRFTLTYIHAAWQMTLDSQRRILTSLEPSTGLELLLLNLAMLPRLLPLEDLASPSPSASSAAFSSPSAAPAASCAPVSSAAPSVPASSAAPSARPEQKSTFPPAEGPALSRSQPQTKAFSAPEASCPAASEKSVPAAASDTVSPSFSKPASAPSVTTGQVSSAHLTEEPKPVETRAPAPRRTSSEWKDVPVDPSLTWADFLESCRDNRDIPLPMLRQVTGEVRGDWLVLQALSQVISMQLQRTEKLRVLEELVTAWAGRPLQIVFRPPQKIVRTEAELKEEIQTHPVIKKFQDAYDARLVRCTPINR